MNDVWPLPRRNDRCHASGTTFEPREPLCVVLCEHPEGFARLDFRLAHEPTEVLAEEVARWRSTFPARDDEVERATPASLLDLFRTLAARYRRSADETADSIASTDARELDAPAESDEDVIDSLDGAPQANPEQLCFVLGLLLWRKRRLTLVGTEAAADEVERWTFAVAKTDEQYVLNRPQLSEAHVNTLSNQLEALLVSGPVIVEPAPTSAAAEERSESRPIEGEVQS